MDPPSTDRSLCSVERQPSDSVQVMATLAAGEAITVLLSMGLDLFFRANGLLNVGQLPEQVMARLEPTLLDLSIALAA